MDFSEKGLNLIKKASTKMEPNPLIQMFVLITLFAGMCTYLFGLMKIEYFMYVSYFIIVILFVLIAISLRGPSYKELVDLLISKRDTKLS